MGSLDGEYLVPVSHSAMNCGRSDMGWEAMKWLHLRLKLRMRDSQIQRVAKGGLA